MLGLICVVRYIYQLFWTLLLSSRVRDKSCHKSSRCDSQPGAKGRRGTRRHMHVLEKDRLTELVESHVIIVLQSTLD